MGTAASPEFTPEKRAPRDVTVQLQYLKDLPFYQKEKPVQITPNFQDTEGKTTVVLESGPAETIQDIRGIDHAFTLDDNGFTFAKSPTTFIDWSSQPKIAEHYLQEMEDLLRREVEGVDEIMFYDARIRQSADGGLRVEGLSYNPFAKQVHRDNTDVSCVQKIRNLTELKADYLLGGRCRIINIWRPIKHPVFDCSLAVADGGKLLPGDVMECERHLAKTGAYHDTMGVVKHRLGFEWFYCGEMEPDDVLLFKNYDSSTSVPARHCLHTAFDLPPEMVKANAPTRESIEVRALVFTYPAGQRRPSTATALSQHPLAQKLAQGKLTRLTDEHSITDRVRTDIDEAGEVKDAMLILRRQENELLKRYCEALTAERDALRDDVVTADAERDRALAGAQSKRKQVEIQASRIESLEAEMTLARQQLGQSQPQLRRQLSESSRELLDARSELVRYRQASMDLQGERDRLLEHVEGLKAQVQRWKDEAMGCASGAVSRCWQASVDEAVRR